MDNLTMLVRREVTRQFKSVRQFAFAVGVPLSTINSALHNGVGGSSFDTVLKMCHVLGIEAMNEDASAYITKDTQDILKKYAALDDLGRHTVHSIIKVEYDRCMEYTQA